MRLPPQSVPVARGPREELYAGVDPAWFRSLIRKVLPIAKRAACVACGLIPNPIAKAACRAAACG